MLMEVSAVKFQQNSGDFLHQVRNHNGSVVINEGGEPIAALVDAELFRRIQKMEARFDELIRPIREAYANVPMEEGLAEIEAVCAAVRKGM